MVKVIKLKLKNLNCFNSRLNMKKNGELKANSLEYCYNQRHRNKKNKNSNTMEYYSATKNNDFMKFLGR